MCRPSWQRALAEAQRRSDLERLRQMTRQIERAMALLPGSELSVTEVCRIRMLLAGQLQQPLQRVGGMPSRIARATRPVRNQEAPATETQLA